MCRVTKKVTMQRWAPHFIYEFNKTGCAHKLLRDNSEPQAPEKVMIILHIEVFKNIYRWVFSVAYSI